MALTVSGPSRERRSWSCTAFASVPAGVSRLRAVRSAVGHRLLAQDLNADPRRPFRVLAVLRMGQSDVNGIDLFLLERAFVVVVAERWHLVFLAQFAGLGWV